MGRMPRSVDISETHKALVGRILASTYLNRSARLQELLIYLTDRVLDHGVDEIHEQEIGRKVFGRSADYDTATDNIVRVHASMLRKRLDQYFSNEGSSEPLIIELPKGNYAPVFSKRPEPVAINPIILERTIEAPPRPQWNVRILAVLLAIFICSTAWLLWKKSDGRAAAHADRPTVDLLWAQVFRPDKVADIVLDDAAVDIYQDLTGRTLTLSEYFDRDYLRRLPGAAAGAGVEERLASSVVLRRYTSYSGVNFLWKLAGAASLDYHRATLHFAREYKFSYLKANNALLVGTSRTNLWIEPFEQKLGVRWTYDSNAGVFVPKDTWNASVPIAPPAAGSTELHEGYFGVALVPNLSGAGNVLIVSGSGGSAINAGMDFLSTEASVSDLRRRLGGGSQDFPKFEALIKVTGRSKLPKDSIIVVCRKLI